MLDPCLQVFRLIKVLRIWSEYALMIPLWSPPLLLRPPSPPSASLTISHLIPLRRQAQHSCLYETVNARPRAWGRARLHTLMCARQERTLEAQAGEGVTDQACVDCGRLQKFSMISAFVFFIIHIFSCSFWLLKKSTFPEVCMSVCLHV